MHWIEAHGFECLVAAFIFSGLTSVMPPLPPGRGWWTTWAYYVMQLAGANLGNMVKHLPVGAKIEALTQTSTKPDGSTLTTEVATATIPKQ